MIKDNNHGPRRNKNKVYAAAAVVLVVAAGVIHRQTSAPATSSSSALRSTTGSSENVSAGAGHSAHEVAVQTTTMDQLKAASPVATSDAAHDHHHHHAHQHPAPPAVNTGTNANANAVATSDAKGDDNELSCCVNDGKNHDSLPSFWSSKCVDGQCIRVCQSWVDDGFFLRGNTMRMNWLNEIHKRGAPVLEKAVDHRLSASSLEISYGTWDYLPPGDAIRFCGVACQSKKEHQQRFASNFCTCGEFPDDFFKLNPLAEDYAKANGAEASGTVDEESKALKAVLRENESQPKCT